MQTVIITLGFGPPQDAARLAEYNAQRNRNWEAYFVRDVRRAIEYTGGEVVAQINGVSHAEGWGLEHGAWISAVYEDRLVAETYLNGLEESLGIYAKRWAQDAIGVIRKGEYREIPAED